MNSKLQAFFKNHGYKLMMIGFALTTVGVLSYIKSMDSLPTLKIVAVVLFFLGVSVYLAGRLGYHVTHRKPKTPDSVNKTKDTM